MANATRPSKSRTRTRTPDQHGGKDDAAQLASKLEAQVTELATEVRAASEELSEHVARCPSSDSGNSGAVPEVVTDQMAKAFERAVTLLKEVRSLCRDYGQLESTIAVLAGDWRDAPEAQEDYRRELARNTGLDLVDDALAAMAATLLEEVGGWPAKRYEELMPEELRKRWTEEVGDPSS